MNFILSIKKLILNLNYMEYFCFLLTIINDRMKYIIPTHLTLKVYYYDCCM